MQSARAAWCERETLGQDIASLRLDTWAENGASIRYYASFGFHFIGQRTSSTSPTLPARYRGVHLALMEKPVLPPEQKA